MKRPLLTTVRFHELFDGTKVKLVKINQIFEGEEFFGRANQCACIANINNKSELDTLKGTQLKKNKKNMDILQ